MCPMQMAGTKLTTSDTSDGVAIAITTPGDVDELRVHVRRMAEMHNSMHGGGGMHGGMESGDAHGGMGSGGAHGQMMHMQMVPSRASVEDIPGGVRLVLVPTDPSQLAALRAQARDHAAMMEKGECPMMQASAPAPEPGADHKRHHPGS